MSTKYLIDLSINLDGSGRTVEAVAGTYADTSMVDDIAETAYNLCGGSSSRMAQEFSGLNLLNSNVSSENGTCVISAHLGVSAASADFVEQVISDYMDGFADCIQRTAWGIWSREGQGRNINLQVLNWEMGVNEITQPL